MSAAASFMAIDPMATAENINTPLLMWIGGGDDFSPVGFENLYTALWRQGKEAKYLYYWGEGHSFDSPANIRHNLTSRLEWFKSHLAQQQE